MKKITGGLTVQFCKLFAEKIFQFVHHLIILCSGSHGVRMIELRKTERIGRESKEETKYA